LYLFEAELMEEWEIEFEWLKTKHYIKERFGMDRLPDLNGVLLLVGIQELGFTPDTSKKEVKQDLMHVAVCTLLSESGYFETDGVDLDGWPHFRKLKQVEVVGEKEQENLLIQHVISYFKRVQLQSNDN
jgi:hypothetical protein